MDTHVSDYMPVTHVASVVDGQRTVLISDHITRILHWFFYAVLCQVIVVFGIVSNIINIICFIKQGFQDPINVSFIGLAISDLGCLITLLWSNICLTPAVKEADLPFDPLELIYLTGAWLHMMFSRITAWITAIITLERCLCITLPLKVKDIITTKRMSVVIAGVFIVFLASLSPVYFFYRVGIKFFPGKNKTLVGNVITENHERFEAITFLINNTVFPALAFMLIIACTIMLVYKLNANSKWRKGSSHSTQAANLSNRNTGVAKMVTTIAILFIACYSPLSIIFIGMSLEPRVSFEGQYVNTFTVLAALCVLLEAINSSSNIVIYFNMSSKYRAVFLYFFGITKIDSSASIV